MIDKAENYELRDEIDGDVELNTIDSSEDEVGVYTFIRETLESLNGDRVQAKAAVRLALKSNPDLYNRYVPQLIDRGIGDCLRSISTRQRRDFFTQKPKASAAPATEFKKADVVPLPKKHQPPANEFSQEKNDAMFRTTLRTWFDVPIYGGKSLENAYQPDLEKTIENYELTSLVAKQRASFFSTILQHMKPGKTVSECVNIEMIGTIASKTLGDTAKPWSN